MITVIERARERLRRAESDLRTVLIEAAGAGDYHAIKQLTTWAEQVAKLAAADGFSAQLSPDTSSGAAVARSNGGRASESGAGANARRSKRMKRPRPKPRPSPAETYPQFFRQREDLVKIGWSRRERKEYQHRASRRVAVLVAQAVREAISKAEIVRSEDFMPLVDPADGSEVPSYQVYVCLAWLRHEKLVIPQGRQGYAVPSAESIEPAVDQSWSRLPSR